MILVKKSVRVLLFLSFFFARSLYADPVEFSRIIKNGGATLASATSVSLEMGVTTYTHPDRALTVTLIPMAHIGEKHFYDSVETLLDHQSMILYEGLRPSGFYGHPFEEDPTLVTQDDFVERTTARVQSIGRAIQNYVRTKKRQPQSWDEVFGPKKDSLQKTLLFDSWGQPLILEQNSDGRLDVVSSGDPNDPNRKEIRFSELPDRPTRLLTRLGMRLIEAPKKFAEKANLAIQPSFQAYTRPGSINVDVSNDQFLDLPLWRFWEIGSRWRARNRHPVERMTAILGQTSSTSEIRMAIVYGAAHGIDFHEQLVLRLGFQVTHQEWLPILNANINQGKASTPADLMRLQLISILDKKLKKQTKAYCERLLNGNTSNTEAATAP